MSFSITESYHKKHSDLSIILFIISLDSPSRTYNVVNIKTITVKTYGIPKTFEQLNYKILSWLLFYTPPPPSRAGFTDRIVWNKILLFICRKLILLATLPNLYTSLHQGLQCFNTCDRFIHSFLTCLVTFIHNVIDTSLHTRVCHVNINKNVHDILMAL